MEMAAKMGVTYGAELLALRGLRSVKDDAEKADTRTETSAQNGQMHGKGGGERTHGKRRVVS